MGKQLTVVPPQGMAIADQTDLVKQLTHKYGSPRVLLVQRILVQSLQNALQTPPEDLGLAEVVGSWLRALEHIPSDQLELYFTKAQAAKTDGYPVNANLIIAEWNKDAHKREMERIEHYSRFGP